MSCPKQSALPHLLLVVAISVFLVILTVPHATARSMEVQETAENGRQLMRASGSETQSFGRLLQNMLNGGLILSEASVDRRLLGDRRKGLVMSERRLLGDRRKGLVMSERRLLGDRRKGLVLSERRLLGNRRKGLVMSERRLLGDRRKGLVMSE